MWPLRWPTRSALPVSLFLCLWVTVTSASPAPPYAMCGRNCSSNIDCRVAGVEQGGMCITCDGASSSGVCKPSCGSLCKEDTDCGGDRWSPCSACADGHCTGNADFGHCDRVPYPGSKVVPAPVLPSSWNASLSLVNYTDGKHSRGFTWYDYTWGALRQDFDAPCPFIEATEEGVNERQCTVLFYEGYNYYIYPEANLCCGYHFPVWAPSSYRTANATYGGVVQLVGASGATVPADWWQFEYACPWTRPASNATAHRMPLGATVQRDVYTVPGGATPLRMNETLTSSTMDFVGLEEGPQQQDTFSGPLLAFLGQGQSADAVRKGLDRPAGCLFEDKDPTFLQQCLQYNAHGRLVYLGYQ